ncbi:sp zinc finger transcription factor-like protein [Daphnia magna]|uniref:Sp zinc finger transcription factor-like protein n=1 Tax=Daphnia magna TaxID=35525 RepID=A0A0P6B4A0_9CRUS|nr:sp zinc finger transcription factor-like protein [Daphnia magna]
MSPLGSSRLMAKCWLTLAVCVAAFWCHPVPDSSNTATTGASRPSLKVEELEQLNEFADSDYPDMMTDFLRLSTAMPTVAASTKSFLVNTPSTSTLPPSTSTKTTTKPSIVNNVSATAGVATAKFIPTVTTTTTRKPTTAINTTPAIIEETTTILPRVQKEQTSAPVIATPVASVEKLQAINKPAGLNEIETSQKTDMQTKPTAVVTQTTANPSSATMQQKPIPSPAATLVQQTATSPAPFNEQWQPNFTGLGQQQAPSAIPPAVVFNQPQQQQMAVGGATAIQQTTNQVQTAASNGPRQQVQVPNFAPMAVPNMQQHQPMMQHPAMVQQMVRNPAFQQQQQFQTMYQNRVPATAQASTNAKQKVKPSSTILTPLANPMMGSNRRPVYFVGGNGAPANLLPLSAWPQLMSNGVQTSPPVATSSV